MTDGTWGTRPASTRPWSLMRPRLSRNATIAAAAFICIPLFILSASAICSWAVAHGASPMWRIPFRIFCHGIPDRCLLLFGVPMPVCARCTAIYVGLFGGLIAYSVMPWIREQLLRRMLWAAVVPLAVDGITQLIHLRESTNALRFGTGLIAGVAFGMWVLSAIENPERHEVRLP